MGDINKVSLGISNVSIAGSDVGYTLGGVKLTFTYEYSETTYDSFGTVVTNKNVKNVSCQIQFSMVERSANTLANIFGVSSDGSGVSVGNSILGSGAKKNDVLVSSVDGNVSVLLSQAAIDSMDVTMTPDSVIEWTVSLTGKLVSYSNMTVKTK